MRETSGLSADLSPERREPSIVQRIVNAWDCCGTCAGGVLGEYVREERAKALREAADDMRAILLSGHTLGMPSDDWLRDRADRIARQEGE